MRQAVVTAPGKIEFGVANNPVAGPGQVRIRIQRIGVCGSDIHVFHGKHPFVTYPLIQGHEYAGVIDTVGEGVSGIHVGDKVTATQLLSDALNVDDRNARALRALGHIREENGDLNQAIVNYQRAYDIDQMQSDLPARIGYLQQRLASTYQNTPQGWTAER